MSVLLWQAPMLGGFLDSPRRTPWLGWGVLLALPWGAVATPAERAFWRPDTGVGAHPVEVSVRAMPVARGTHLHLYREEGYLPGGEAGFAKAVEELMVAFEGVIHPCLTAVFGTPPDVDGNGAVIVLVTRPLGAPARFWRFNQLPNHQARLFGFHSNEAEILYTDLGFSGNRRVDNAAGLAQAYAELLLFARDPAKTAWSRALAAYGPVLCGVSNPRRLWQGGVEETGEAALSSSAPGLWLPAFEYLRQRGGEAALAALATTPAQGLHALDDVVRQRGLAGDGAALLADAAMAAWLDDPHIGDGRFAFRGTHPLPARAAVEVDTSRASAGQVTGRVGFPTYLLLRHPGERAQPLTLQGQPEVRWVGRAVRRRPRGPDEEMPLSFSLGGTAHLDLTGLRPGEEVLLALFPLPPGSPTFDRRSVSLLWGLGWVPRLPGRGATEDFKRLLAARFPDGGGSATASLSTLFARLTGQAPTGFGETLTTRYAWAPEAARVPELLLAEARERRLPARRQVLLRLSPTRVAQEWSNVLIELPGADPRRWPVVVAAHWDAGRAHLDDAYAEALGAHHNASGVAVALEAAGAIARAPRRAPVLVALLAGGRHGAAGAQALLEELQGRVTIWVELDGLGVPAPFPHHATVNVTSEAASPLITAAVFKAFRDQGLVLRRREDAAPPHGAAHATGPRGIPTLVFQTAVIPPDAPEADLPADLDAAATSPELMVLLARAVANLAVTLAGPVTP